MTKNTNPCRNFSFLVVQKQKGFYRMNADGILGLAPKPMRSEDPEIFIRELHKQKIISHPIFSLYMSEY